jgi:hypothetical protein
MTRIPLLLILISFVTTAQMKETFDLKAIDKDNGIHIFFKNTNSDGFYLDGVFMHSYGKLILSKEQVLVLLDDAGKLVRKDSGVIQNELYTLEKFNFDEDTVFLAVKDKIGSLTKDRIKELKKRYEE